MRKEEVILSNLINNESYSRKVIPFLKEDYFLDIVDRTVFSMVKDYSSKYSTFPDQTVLMVELGKVDFFTEDQYDTAVELISKMNVSHPDKEDWLLEISEDFCIDKSIYNGLMKCVKILDGDSTNISKSAIPQIMTDALAVSFDTNIGHDFLSDFEQRYEYYHKKHKRVPFDLDYMNRITKGGLIQKTLSVILAGTGVGKSLFMCHNAAYNLVSGYNVLYITMEMSEMEISRRIDCNLLDVTMDDLEELPLSAYVKKMERLNNKTHGKLIVKEYPTSSASSANFRYLLEELKMKLKFVPDIVYIDYLNICASARVKTGNNVNSYTLVKSIAEELRGLAMEFNVPIVTATQTTRSGYANSDPGLEDVSESFGTNHTADLVISMVSTDTLKELNQVKITQLKNRYNDTNKYHSFVLGIDRPKMKLYDTEQSAQEDLIDGPVMDNTEVGERIDSESKPKKKLSKEAFKGFK
jgi:archaellum biogenesis ATPase FlaH